MVEGVGCYGATVRIGMYPEVFARRIRTAVLPTGTCRQLIVTTLNANGHLQEMTRSLEEPQTTGSSMLQRVCHSDLLVCYYCSWVSDLNKPLNQSIKLLCFLVSLRIWSESNRPEPPSNCNMLQSEQLSRANAAF